MGTTGAAAVTWVARPMMGTPTLPGAVRWGVIHAPTGRWVAFGSEARCRALVAPLTEVGAILARRAADAAGGGAWR
jgi:hypothetical protein